MRSEPKPFSKEAALRSINRAAWSCKNNCTFCHCSQVVQSVLGEHRLWVAEVLDLHVIPEQLKSDIQRAQRNFGEHVTEMEDYLDINTYRPISDSFLAVSDDEL